VVEITMKYHMVIPAEFCCVAPIKAFTNPHIKVSPWAPRPIRPRQRRLAKRSVDGRISAEICCSITVWLLSRLAAFAAPAGPIMKIFARAFCLLVVTLGLVTASMAEENSGAALYRKCETYLAGANGKRLSADEANDAGYCSGLIDAAVAAARLAHERHGRLLRDGEPAGNVDTAAYQAFALGILLGTDDCLPDNVNPHEVAVDVRRWGRLDPELLYNGYALLDFVLMQSYLCQ
jgi:hypothetical protein